MKPNQKILLTSTIVGIITLVLIVFLINPLFREIKKNSQELILAKKELISLQAKIENLEQFRESYKDLKPDLEKIDQILIDQKVPINFIKFLEKTGENSGILIEISSISPGEIETDPWPALGLQINLTASFPNFLKFLEKIETSPYLIEVQNFALKRLTTEELKLKKFENFSLGDINGNLSIKVFGK